MPTHTLPDGALLAYDDVGQGRPVVLLHGMSMSRGYFARNVDALASRFRVLNVDLRSHGESPTSPGGNTVAQMARDVHHLIGALGLERPVLVGWSMGTMVTWDLVRQFGADAIGGHVVVSQGPSDLVRDDWPLGAFPLPDLLALLAGAQGDYRATMEEIVPLMVKHAPGEDELRHLVDMACTIDPNAGTCVMLDQSVQDYRDVLAGPTPPTLLTWGRDEKLISVANGEWLSERLGVPLHVFEESGHCPMWEEPEAWSALVADWVGSLA